MQAARSRAPVLKEGKSSPAATTAEKGPVRIFGICFANAAFTNGGKRSGDQEKNPLWQGFPSGLLKQPVPEDLEFRACSCFCKFTMGHPTIWVKRTMSQAGMIC